jgi:glycosyltransferase involved in cell wall biosynthesis
MNLQNPKVTVLMPVYNGEKYLSEAIDSILAQSYKNFELLIINDGSTDNCVSIINSYNDPRIRLVHNEKNLKLIATLNKGLELAQGEYIARMDCDDISLPERLAKQVAFMDSNPAIGICGTWVKTFGELDGHVWQFPPEPDQIKAGLFFENQIAHPSVLIRRASLKEFNLSYDPQEVHAEDYGLWLKCSRLFSMANVPEVLLMYRFTSTSVSRVNIAAQQETLKQICRENLGSLGIEFLTEDLKLHWAICLLQPEKIKDFINRTEVWLTALKAKNADQLIYPEPAFSEAISTQWFKICNLTTCLGLWTFYKYWRSPLHYYQDLSIKQIYRFLTKCLIRHQNR